MLTITALSAYDKIHPEFTSECRISVWLSQVSSSAARSARQQVTKLSGRRTNAVIASPSLPPSLSLALSPSSVITWLLKIPQNVFTTSNSHRFVSFYPLLISSSPLSLSLSLSVSVSEVIIIGLMSIITHNHHHLLNHHHHQHHHQSIQKSKRNFSFVECG